MYLNPEPAVNPLVSTGRCTGLYYSPRRSERGVDGPKYGDLWTGSGSVVGATMYGITEGGVTTGNRGERGHSKGVPTTNQSGDSSAPGVDFTVGDCLYTSHGTRGEREVQWDRVVAEGGRDFKNR